MMFSTFCLIFSGASFMLGRCLISTVWGIAADRIGRKPIVMFGIFSVLGIFFLPPILIKSLFYLFMFYIYLFIYKVISNLIVANISGSYLILCLGLVLVIGWQ